MHHAAQKKTLKEPQRIPNKTQTIPKDGDELENVNWNPDKTVKRSIFKKKNKIKTKMPRTSRTTRISASKAKFIEAEP